MTVDKFRKSIEEEFTKGSPTSKVNRDINKIGYENYLMIEYAKYHVKLALENASKNCTLLVDGCNNGNRYIAHDGNHFSETEVDIDKDSILNSYNINDIQ